MGDRLNIGIWLRADEPIIATAQKARIAEEAGIDFVGVTDGQMIWRDVYLALAAVAQETNHVQLGPWVTNPVTRHPTVSASAICTLDELSDGRAFLGIGAGDDSVRTLNMKPASLDHLAETVGLIRTLSEGGTVSGEPNTWRLATARRMSPAIYWAASLKESLLKGGSVADGVIDSGWLVPEMLREAVETIERGARLGGREPSSVAKILNSALSIGADGSEARQRAKTYVARGLVYKRSASVPGWSEEQRQRLRAKYDFYDHLSERQAAVDLVPDELVPSKSISGTPSEAVSLLRMAHEAGYTHAALLPLGDFEQTMRIVHDEVLPYVK